MSFSTLIAQVSDVVSPHMVLYSFGPLGVFCAWLMLRVEKFMTRAETMKADLSKELRGVGHRLNELNTALLVQALGQQLTPPARKLAHELLDKIKAQTRKEDQT